MTADPIIDPRNGRLISVYDLARDVGVAAYIIWHRWDEQGIRSLTLIAPKGTPIDIDHERLLARRLFLGTTAGILATHRLGDFAHAAKTKRQHQRSEAA